MSSAKYKLLYSDVILFNEDTFSTALGGYEFHDTELVISRDMKIAPKYQAGKNNTREPF